MKKWILPIVVILIWIYLGTFIFESIRENKEIEIGEIYLDDGIQVIKSILEEFVDIDENLYLEDFTCGIYNDNKIDYFRFLLISVDRSNMESTIIIWHIEMVV